MTGLDLEKDLNPEQREAVIHGDGPVLILAGAGSGKTRVLTYRFANLVHQCGVAPWRILAVTFTNKAASEMRERISTAVGEHLRTPWIGTFHSIGARMLRGMAERAGYSPDFTIFDGDDQRSLIKTICRDHGLDPTSERVGRLRAWISARKTSREGAVPDEDWGAARDEFRSVQPAYEAALRRMNALDFDDLLVIPARILAEDSELLEEHVGRFEHTLVDEYQDTNGVQNELVRLFSSATGNVCAVGDDDQSIYRWRGADLENILAFEETFPGAHVIRLEQNYRSTKPILDAAAAVIENNRGRRGKRLWTDRPGGELLAVESYGSERDEAFGIVRTIQRLMGMSGSFSDYALFYRTNAQSRALEEALRIHAMPYVIIGGTRFYERMEVKDALAYLRVLVNRADDLSLGRILNTPTRGIGAKTKDRLISFAAHNRIPLADAAARADEIDGLGPRARNALKGFAEIIDRYSEAAATVPPDRLLADLVREIRLVEYYEEKEGEKGALRAENIEELAAGVGEFVARKGDALLSDFLAEVSLLTDIDSWDEHSDAVTLMTLHNSKGLEFSHVFLTGMEEGLLPHMRSIDEDEEVEEERRLFYVGLTRAKDRVFLSHVKSRIRFGEIAPSTPSRFLDEIPVDLVVKSGGEDRRQTRRPRRPIEAKSIFPDYEDESQEYIAPAPAGDYSRGDMVRHASWGNGTVVSVEGSGPATMISVEFHQGFTKKIMVRYAKLERIAGRA